MNTDTALPTESMVVVGMEAMAMLRMTEGYDALTGCQQGAESARVCWAAMVAEMHSDQPRQSKAPSDHEILAAWAESHWITYDQDPAGVVKFGRLLFERYEQAVLQSPGIQALKKDAERYRAWRAASCLPDDTWVERVTAALPPECEDDDRAPTEAELDYAIDAAMQEQKT